MKYFYIVPLIITIASFGQEIQYFPQEEIILNECDESGNKSDCLYNYLEKKVSTFLTKNQKLLKKIKKDTLKTGGRLILDSYGNIVKEKSYFSISSKHIGKKAKKSFENLAYEIEVKKVLNRKPDSVVSSHFLYYDYLINDDEDGITFTLLENKKKYTGGVIEKVPRYPGCENLSETEARRCFQMKMQEHIKYHFRYPKEAISQKLSGKVSIIFIISKTGEIENIRTRGPHSILEEEAVRIIKFLPNMAPGKQNGEPVKVPFSIPITFRL